MEQNIKKMLVAALLVAGAQSAFAAGPSNPDADPPRWYVEDVTPQARYLTLKKEIGAAYQEALAECKAMRGAEKNSCLKEARATFNADMANAKAMSER